MIEKKIIIEKNQVSKIFVGNRIAFDKNLINNLIGKSSIIIISDENVFKLYPEVFADFKKIIIPSGEQEKNINRIDYILKKFVDYGIDKNSIIIGFGGGVICDIAGFAASVYMRGCKFGFIASTLLAQIDAAIGGKNGVNLGKNKNFIGLINQPEFVIADTSLLKTLSDEDYKSGIAELIKYAVIADKDLFEKISINKSKILFERDSNLMQSLVQECISIKSNIITQDPDDNYLRHILNFGHTFGHSIEVIEDIKHGFAVAEGMKIACKISEKKSLLRKANCNKIIKLINSFGFELDISLNTEHHKFIRSDKKKNRDHINFIMLQDIGKPKIVKLTFNDLTTSI